MRRGAGADAATSAGVPNTAPWALRRRSPTIRSTTIAGITSRPSSAIGRPEASSALPEMRGEDAEPVTSRREHDVRGTGCGEVGRDLAPLLPRRPRRTASAGSHRSCRREGGRRSPDPRTTPRPRRRARPRAGRGSRRRARRAGRRGRGAAAASRAGRESRRRRRRARAGARRRRAATAPAPARWRRPGRPRRRARAAVPTRPARPCRGGNGVGEPPPNGRQPDAVPAHAGGVAERERDAHRDVGLAAIGRAESHRRRLVEHDPGDEHALGELHPDVRLPRARGHVPVDQADVVARLVRPHLRELAAAPEHVRAVIARQQAVDAPADRELERAEQRLRHRPGTGALRRLDDTECPQSAVTLLPAARARAAASRPPAAPGRARRPPSAARRARGR